MQQSPVQDAWLLAPTPWPPFATLEPEKACQILLGACERAAQLEFEWRMMDAPAPQTLALCYLDPNSSTAPGDGVRYGSQEQSQRVSLPLAPNHPLFGVLGAQVELEMFMVTRGFQPPKLDSNGKVVQPSPDTSLRRLRKRFRLLKGPYTQLQVCWWGAEPAGPALPPHWAAQALRTYPLPTPPSGSIMPFRSHPTPQNSMTARTTAPQQQQYPSLPPHLQQLQQRGAPAPPAVSSYQQQQALVQQRQKAAAAAAARPGPANPAPVQMHAPTRGQTEEFEQVGDVLDQVSLRMLVGSRYKNQHIDIAPVFDAWSVKDILLEWNKDAEKTKEEEASTEEVDPEQEKAKLQEQLAGLQQDIADIERKRRETKAGTKMS